ncbi:UDP-N-acetylmuramyl pentapeptide phosphotransferase/UDP-N-acetylglucosamine-1-phosphate transferase [Abditibacterium utsteinense]|uniref:UDP-N-acetylmuramyl pentapeptide phosphotransferase/UDP-N-acetylglucosamine-1-phosphate transferase n=2 Tax=Abditibacterium utsteinense TaxID=1960156 RepID=A0A2S8SNW4_9BACT|nr:UDP-N-acetylmuramyl pentapeptide phosphotransferase/UDP-N-acetylglucosamine-1-phosphate transferase [Abditibacterium utsteinense]
MFAAGLYDDWRELKPLHKLIPQLIAAGIFVWIFYITSPPIVLWLVPFAIVWIIGITNAVNLLDNMDGLSSGVSCLISFFMAAYAAYIGDTFIALGSIVLAGATAGFLVFNFNPAKIFMGDCGALFIGYSLAALSLISQKRLLSSDLFSALLLPTLILATPLFDTLFVAVVRFVKGRPVSLGGRDHTSHRLVMLGLSEKRAVLWLYAITVWFGLVALYGVVLNSWIATGAVAAFSWIVLSVLGLFLAEADTYTLQDFEQRRTKLQSRLNVPILGRIVIHRRRVVEAIVDLGAICASWIAAYLLRFEENISQQATVMIQALPFIIASQLIGFYICGVYRTLWRYITISDLAIILRSIALGTVISWCVVRLMMPNSYPSTAVLMIFAVLLLTASGGFRLGLKALRYHFSLHWRHGQRRVLIFGAGDTGWRTANEIVYSPESKIRAVGFLDDDPKKQGFFIHGLKVLGTRQQLPNIVEQQDIHEIIIAMPPIAHGEAIRQISQLCLELGIESREARGITD